MAIAAGDIITYNGSAWVYQPRAQGKFAVSNSSDAPATQLEVRQSSANFWGQTTPNTWAGSTTPQQALTLTNGNHGGWDPVMLYRMATSTGVIKTAGAIGLLGRGAWTNGDEPAQLATQIADMYFILRDGAGTLQERMRITSEGKVGMGIAGLPATQLDIVKTGIADPVTGANMRLVDSENDANNNLFSIQAGATGIAGVTFGDGKKTGGSGEDGDRGSIRYANQTNNTGEYLTLHVAGEKVRIQQQDGLVGIGQSSPSSKLHVEGPIATKLTTVNGNTSYSVAATDSVILLNTTDGAITATLPSAGGAAGRVYTFKRVTAGGNGVTISAASGQNIDANADYTNLDTRWDYVVLVSNGSDRWLIIANN